MAHVYAAQALAAAEQSRHVGDGRGVEKLHVLHILQVVHEAKPEGNVRGVCCRVGGVEHGILHIAGVGNPLGEVESFIFAVHAFHGVHLAFALVDEVVVVEGEGLVLFAIHGVAGSGVGGEGCLDGEVAGRVVGVGSGVGDVCLGIVVFCAVAAGEGGVARLEHIRAALCRQG